ncbi:MAG: hypothetical protein E7185_00950 [Erysipelotrichaceae bacterium]|nr:hypothetical protein [Erysipelotrichaceae bacterium]
MRNWQSFYEILKFPLCVIFFAVCLIGLGNLITNPVYGFAGVFSGDTLISFGELFIKIGQFLVVNFPLLFLIRLTTRRGGSAATIISALSGYVTFLATTMYFADPGLPSTAYSSILGLSVNRTSVVSLTGATHYPLQTGLIGAIIVTMITLWSFNGSRRKTEYGFFSFVSKEMSCVLRTVFFSVLAGLAMSFVWPYAVQFIQRVVHFISVDTNNPINLALYGISERLLGVLGLGTAIRQPFWYEISGGSWVNAAGISVSGDVNIWTAQLAANGVTGMAGRFFTPYYILNIFAMPAMIWAAFSLDTNPMEKRRMILLCIIGTLASLLWGTLLPLELILLILCPLLFAFHVSCTGILYMTLQSLHIYLGYQSTDTITLTARPGSLPEFISYIQYPALARSLIGVAVAGIITGAIYFLVTRLYFRYLAMDLFKTGSKDEVISAVIKASGGIENIKMTNSSIAKLTLSVYDPGKVDVQRLRRLGSHRIYENRAGFNICFGAPSTMIRLGIDSAMRDAVREVNRM